MCCVYYHISNLLLWMRPCTDHRRMNFCILADTLADNVIDIVSCLPISFSRVDGMLDDLCAGLKTSEATYFPAGSTQHVC